jgi:transcriptional regulator with XRE-family HTH domain
MNDAQKIIGACIRAIREQRGLSLESLSYKAGISYQYLSGVETGKENFSIQVLSSLAAALEVSLRSLIVAAFDDYEGARPPKVIPAYFRPSVPLPDGLTVHHIESAANLTQLIIHRINRNLSIEVGQPLQSLIQGNNFSGLVSNILCNAMDQCTPYRHYHHQRYPDLYSPNANWGRGEGLEVKSTMNVGKGGESHNGHSGWHMVTCYKFLVGGDIQFVHIMLAQLNGHLHPPSDWKYVGSTINSETGSRRTETYVTTLMGTTKLRDGSVYLDTNYVDYRRWRQNRIDPVPEWSIFVNTIRYEKPT